MSRFGRSGHYRTNQHGTTFWVSGHNVSRDDWTAPQWSPTPVRRAYTVDDVRAPDHNITIPNAKCPECGDPVFFFMDVHGGRVFFDHLGKPWPKHPCISHADADVPGFDDLEEIEAWMSDRRAVHGPGAPDVGLVLAPGYTCSEAHIVRRPEATIAVVHMDDGVRAFVVEGAWRGRAVRRVYHRAAAAPDRPETLDYLDDDMTPMSVTIVAETDVPRTVSLPDLAAVAEGAMPEIEAWASRHLPGLRPRLRIKLDGHAVGIAGRIGHSRVVLVSLAPWFDVPDDQGHDKGRTVLSKGQVTTWTGRLGKALDRSKSMLPDPLYRDVFVWLTPPWSNTSEVEWAVEAKSEVGRSHGTPRQMAASETLPGRHVFQELHEAPDARIKETRRAFDDLVVGEHAWLIRSSTESRERSWLAAVLNAAELDRPMAALEREGVRFEFRGTGGYEPQEWGQQAILPDGRRLLVMLHLSSAELGLALVRFGVAEDDGDIDEVIPADRLFHAKKLADIIERLAVAG